jgi:hypothetical protein
VAIFLTGAFTANSRGLYMIRCAQENAAASKILQQRMEQLRSASWTEITDADSVKAFYVNAPDAADGCKQNSETVTLSAWPAVGGVGITRIQRATNGGLTVPVVEPNLADQPAVLVTTRVTWAGVGGRSRIRETATVIANGGIGR